MRRVATLLLPLLAAVVLAATAAAPAPAAMGTPRVVGGGAAASADAPWQALVLPGPYVCGGSILDATHVVTAAHCVYDEDAMRVIAPSTVIVRAGILNATTDVGQQRTVSAISLDPDYAPDLQTSDVAILTLSTPLTLDGTSVQSIGLTDVGWRPVPGVTNLQLSGWGATAARSPAEDPDTSDATDQLQVAKTLHATDACSSVYSPFDDNLLLCAGQTGLDACQGDSGGPLAFHDTSGWKLAGIVTGGAGCAWDGYPGYYARVSAPPIHAFLASLGVGYALGDPVFTRPPALQGAAQAGGTLTCAPGTVDHAYTYAVGFTSGGSVIATGSRLGLGARDVGASISCLVVAYGLTGTVEARTAPVVVTAAPPAPEPPAPPSDTAAPVARVLTLRCAKGVCVLTVRVDDPAPSNGVAGVDARVQTVYRSTCRAKGAHKARRCTKTVLRRLRAVRTAINTYKITTPRLRRGTQRFTLYGVDVRGHRQARATTVTKTTR